MPDVPRLVFESGGCVFFVVVSEDWERLGGADVGRMVVFCVPPGLPVCALAALLDDFAGLAESGLGLFNLD